MPSVVRLSASSNPARARVEHHLPDHIVYEYLFVAVGHTASLSVM